MKICSVCGVEKDTGDFRKGGRQCRACRVNQQREYFKQNREKANAATAKWTREHPEERLAAKRIWKEKNHEKVNAQARADYWRNKEVNNQRARDYKKRNPERTRAYNANRKALLRGAIGSVSASAWDALKWICGQVCLGCGRSDVRLTQDHIVPLKQGGVHSIKNMQPLCSSCNSKKRITAIDFRPLHVRFAIGT